MDEWVERHREDVEHALDAGDVRDVDFAGPTYQVEVYDSGCCEICWPFLQFDENGKLKDAFCSCPCETDDCLHLAIAIHSVLDQSGRPLHLRFEHSFWNQLCKLLGDHSGYEERFLQKKGNGHYTYQNDILFEIKAKAPAAQKILKSYIEERTRETPETSIKFSNLTQDEVDHWREGRPSPSLRYTLSLWFDLAKWMMRLSNESTLSFQEDTDGFPTHITAEFSNFLVYCELTKKDLIKLIPSIGSVKSSLLVFKAAEEKVKKISFDPKVPQFTIEHEAKEGRDLTGYAKQLGDWAYVPDKGFYPINGRSMLSHDQITKKDIPEFIQNYSKQISQFIPIHEKSVILSYTLYFDVDWNLHFIAYLFDKKDLIRPDSAFFESWAYLHGKGFLPIEEALFDSVEKVLSPSKVSHFVNHHRIWLNGQEGFQTHLASIESHLAYSVTDKNTLLFHTKTQGKAVDSMDFGDWIYYAGQGFFSKKHARLGLTVRPGIAVNLENVSAFIKTNREELESIPQFFSTNLPLKTRGLEISAKSKSSIHVKPVYTLAHAFAKVDIRIFGDFVFIKDIGFCELPVNMRLPDAYSQPVTIDQVHLLEFFEKDLPMLSKYILEFDSTLRTPHRSNLEVHYLARTGGGGLKAQLFYITEYGRVAVTDLLDAHEHKRRFYFSEAGLIDLRSENYQWMHHFKNAVYPESKSIQLSTMEFIRLDAHFGLLSPPEDVSTAEITRSILKELREFSAHESPNLKGLKSTLRLYQQTGVQWLWFLYKNGLSGLLCDDMGLGKTHQSMALIAATLNQKSNEKKRFLVVCPTSVIYHWQDKLETFLPNMKVHTFHGLKRSLKRLPKEGLILTSYGILRLEKEALQEIPFEVAVFDEIQVAKNPHSRVHEALTHIRARMSIGLTGTPIENSLRELKSLFDIVLPGYMPGEARFREIFITPIERDLDEEKKALLTQLIRPFTLRRRKAEVLQELPEKSEDKSLCELSQEQVKLYQETLALSQNELIADLRNQDANINFIHIFSLLSRLKQVCDHPALVHKDPKNYKSHTSGKWDLFVELLEEARESEQKVVVFSQYLYMLDIMESYLKERKWGYAQIRGGTINRRDEIKRFQEDPDCVVFIGSLQAAGLGIDLTAASVVIMYDRWWNAARENQAIDRVHRIGQKLGVQVYKLITKNTIEEKIDRMIIRKGRLLEEVVTTDDQAVLKKFTRSELIDLLSFES